MADKDLFDELGIELSPEDIVSQALATEQTKGGGKPPLEKKTLGGFLGRGATGTLEGVAGLRHLPGQVADLAKMYVTDHPRYAKNVLAGTAEIGQGLLNVPSNITKALAEYDVIPEWVAESTWRPQQQDFAARLGIEGERPGDVLARSLPKMPAYMAGGGTGLLGKGAFQAGKWGLLGAMEDENPLALAGTAYAPGLMAKGFGKGLGVASDATRAIGGISKDVIKAAQKRLGKYDFAEDLLPERTDIKDVRTRAVKKVGQAKEMDLDLLPSEAMGSPTVAAWETGLGKTKKGAGALEEMFERRKGQENKAVDDFFSLVRKGKGEAPAESYAKIRDTAVDMISEQLMKRKAISKPFYDVLKPKRLPKDVVSNMLDNEIIMKAAQDTYKNPVYKQELKNLKVRGGVEHFDLIKRRIDDQIASAKRAGNNNEARILQQAKEQITGSLDELHPEYKLARKIFETESKTLEGLQKSNLGKLANLTDENIRKVGDILFSKKEIDAKTRQNVTSKLLKENPDVYYDALARNMQDKIKTIAADATGRKAPAFYRNILADADTYNSYKEYLKHNKPALKRFETMKDVFQDLRGDITVKTAAGMKKAGVLDYRNWIDKTLKYLGEGGDYDSAAVKFISDPLWIKEVDAAIRKSGGDKAKIKLNSLKLLDKIAKANKAAAAVKEPKEEQSE